MNLPYSMKRVDVDDKNWKQHGWQVWEKCAGSESSSTGLRFFSDEEYGKSHQASGEAAEEFVDRLNARIKYEVYFYVGKAITEFDGKEQL